ncbi:MAG: transglycosylase SLT domain-containing protein [Nitrospira sp. CR1.3]|nr:transglycosylase SLT domain-containing protein [Nitrospira sp. CR1.3]
MHDRAYQPFLRRLFLAANCLLFLAFPASHRSHADGPAGSPVSEPESCETAEACFQAGALPRERLGKMMTKEQVLSLKLERLRSLMERFPSTLWAKRAGLLSGVLLVERNPAVSIQFLRGAQRDFPVLDDYIRLWLGEASLNLGDTKQAAGMFESVPLAVPDSNILAKAAYRAGEAWYQASSCPEANEWFAKAIALSDKEPNTPQAFLRRAACLLRDNSIPDGREILRQLWVRFPSSQEARESETLLASNLGGEQWTPQPAERFARAQAFLALAFHAEAIEELKKFLAADPHSPRRSEAKLKLGVAQVRLKQYDQARDTFRALMKEGGTESQEAAVWLARVYLRQGLGDKLMELARTLQNTSLSAEQKGQIGLFAGIWLEDQKQFDEAITRYRHVAKSGEPASQREEGQWRVGWVYYRTGRYREASDTLQLLIERHDGDFEPQALYWMARAAEQSGQSQAPELYRQLCQRFIYTYYCQLARERMGTPAAVDASPEATSTNADPSANGEAPQPATNRVEIEQQNAYRRAIELKTLGLDADAAREVAVLTDRYGRDPDVLIALSTMLNEVGAYHHALRLARARFRDKLERTGGSLAPALWNVAYPTGLLPTIKLQGAKGVDPYLIAAIIREESQYDLKAVSRVGAIGLMQVMPATATSVAQRVGLPAVGREDLFDLETNIRIGVRYVEQLLEQFSGNLVYTVAAYNAGPLVVNTWRAQHGNHGQDEFVEMIPYQETRQYVKRVMRSYREYVRLASVS